MKYFLTLFLCYASAYAELSMPEFDRACAEMKWIREGCHELPQSHSEINVPDNHVVLIGNDAIRYRNLIDCIAEDNSIEAVIFAKQEPYDSVILKSYHNEGYIPLSDWQEINPIELMALIIANTEEANRQRHSQGIDEKIEVIGWLKAPTKDLKTYSVFWAIEAMQGKEHIVNSVAIKLSRHGYEQFTWVTPKAYYQPSGGALDIVLNAHRFRASDGYEAFIPGDKIATYGITSLIEEVSGARSVRGKSDSWQVRYFAAIATMFTLFSCCWFKYLNRKKSSASYS